MPATANHGGTRPMKNGSTARTGCSSHPALDHLFDRGFITFEDDGQVIVSPVAHRRSLAQMGIDPASRQWSVHSQQGRGTTSSSRRESSCGPSFWSSYRPRVHAQGSDCPTLEGRKCEGSSTRSECRTWHAVCPLGSVAVRTQPTWLGRRTDTVRIWSTCGSHQVQI